MVDAVVVVWSSDPLESLPLFFHRFSTLLLTCFSLSSEILYLPDSHPRHRGSRFIVFDSQ